MGVPALFRWLQRKYPKIISPVVEEKPTVVNGEEWPADTTGPNPNGEEMDNLYLDMNGIVHPCSHPEDKPAPETEEEMMLEVFKYTDRVVKMVRPRKLLLIAVDGVAPRAKMNQQRSRRFRSAREAQEKDDDKEEYLRLLKSKKSKKVDEDMEHAMKKKTWDSNSITPGTPFMDILASSLRFWCSWKLNTDPAWAKLKVIISDSTVPGEGEHKIMEFIRSQRSSPNHDPNTRHVIYGLDADLIMLGLATHEPHFRVLREDVFNQGFDRKCHICGQEGHEARQCRGEPRKKEDGSDEKQPDRPLKPFIWLHVSILREYLEVELNVSLQKFRFDLERALDDWVFMCFFVGNDFLPHLPSLDIRENGIDTLIAIWKDNIPVMGGYVTCDGIVDLARAQTILEGLAKQEDAIFRRRRENSERQEQNNKRRKLEADHRQAQKEQREGRSAAPAIKNSKSKTKAFAEPPANLPLFKPGEHNPTATRLSYDLAMNRGIVQGSSAQNKSAAAALKEQMLKKSGAVTSVPNGLAGDAGDKNGVQADDKITASVPLKRKLDELEKTDGVSTDLKASEPTTPAKAKEDETEQEDTVRMWEPGYNARYYDQKFGVDPSNKEFRHQVARDYVEGLAWVLLYYFQGCPSWTWYYPYHYAPFAADFVNLEAMNIEFEKGVPFRPFEQLMGVLPAASRHAIPEIFHDLMTKEDSNIIDFYPEEFKIDMNGKKMAWQGIALLPFIDEKRLLSAMATKYPGLSDEEAARNAVGDDVLIVSDEHSLYNEFAQNFYSKRQADMKFNLNQRSSDGLAGKVKKNTDFMPRGSLTFPLADGKLEDVEDNRAMIVHYEMPKSVHIHKSMLMAGLKMPRKVLERRDIDGVKSRGRDSGRSYGGAPLHDNNPGSFNMRNINYAAAAKIQQPQYPSAPSAVTFPPPMHPAMLAQFGQQNGQASGLPFPPQLPPQFFTPHNSGGPPPPPPGYGGPPLRGGPVAIPPPSGFSYQGSQQNLGFQNRQNGFNR